MYWHAWRGGAGGKKGRRKKGRQGSFWYSSRESMDMRGRGKEGGRGSGENGEII